MLSARWKKALRDLWASGARTAMAIAAIALGVVGVGSVSSAFVVLEREMAAEFARTRPASASVWTEPVDDSLVEQVRHFPSVANAEARRTISARVQIGRDQWKPMLLFVIRDFRDLRLDVFEPELGQFPPRDGEILLERVARRVVPSRIGDALTIQVPGSSAARLTMSGTVHAPGLAPAWMEGMGYGFITQETAKQLGGPATLDELKLSLVGDPTRAQIAQRTQVLVTELGAEGHTVSRVEIHAPGKHPHASQLATLLFLLEAFGLLALVLGAVLVASMVTSLLAQQTRQIGVMKAIGASRSQIAQSYFAVVATLGVIASGPAVVASIGISRIYSGLVAKMLNFDLADTSIPWTALALQMAVGIAVPLLVAAWPIWRGTRITVREALSEYGVSAGSVDAGTKLAQRLRGLPSSALYALRGLVRGRGRIALTLFTLVAGGATFLAAANIGAAMDSMVAQKFEAQPYDLHVTFATPQAIGEAQSILASVPGAGQVEAWGGGWVSRVRSDTSLGNAFRVFAPPASSRLSGQHEVLAGRWLTPQDRDALVVNQLVVDAEPDLTVGSRVKLAVGGRPHDFVLVGVVRERVSPMAGYTTYQSYAEAMGQPGLAQAAVVSAVHRDRASTAALAQAVERVLRARGIAISDSLETADFRKAVEDHLVVIARVLLAMSLLVVAVGGLGLASAMSIRVLERTREIGVIRALGASRGDVMRIVLLEGGAIGLASCLLAAALAVPVSAWMSQAFGMIFFKAPLVFSVSPTGLVLWLGLVMVVVCVASLLPALKAANVPVARAIAYE